MISLEEYIKNGKFHEVNILASYHNHNYLCHHAGGKVIDYAKKAKEKGLLEVGISDHANIPQIGWRMTMDEFYNNYLKQFDEAKEIGIKIYKGLEIEYFEENAELYKEYKKYLDYFVMGQHIYYKDGIIKSGRMGPNDDEDYILYVDTCIKGLKTGLFKFIAHPEIVFFSVQELSQVALEQLERLVKFCTENDIIMEVNVNGIRHPREGKYKYAYPRQEFLNLVKKYNTKVIVSDDAHNPNEMIDDITKMVYSYLEDNNFNIVYKLDL